MNISWYIAKKIIIPAQKTFSSFIVKLCIVATAISVAVMIISTALFDGFEKAIANQFFNCWGNIHIMNYDPSGQSFVQQNPVYLDKSLLNNVKLIPQVKSIHPYGIQNTVFKSKSGLQGALLKGVTANYDWQRVKSFLVEGNQITYPTDGTYSKDILLSKTIATKLQMKVHDSLIAYFVDGQGDLPRARKLHICGIYQTGLQENDKLFAYADLGLLHKIQNDSLGGIFGYEIITQQQQDVPMVKKEIQTNLIAPPLEAYSIQERFSYVFQWLQLIKSDLSLIYIIMLIVALLNIVSSILILILERTNMVGILKSVGMANGKIQMVFFYQSIWICLIGVASGIVLALVLCALQYYIPFIHLNPEVYYVKNVQVYVHGYKVLGIALGTIVACAILLIIPTIIVRKIVPIKALRFD